MRDMTTYRDKIAIFVAFIIPFFLYPQLSISKDPIKYSIVGAFIVVMWYLGATRNIENPWKKNKKKVKS